MNEIVQRVLEQFDELPVLLSGHLLLSVCSLGVGASISLPLGVVCARSARWRVIALSIAGILQTIPSLALLALMVPILGGTIGFFPAFVALVLYSVLPMLRNTVAGVSGTDPTLVEAARGLGMTERQVLLKVRLPLAAPVIVAGVRTAAVWVVGMTTLATAVGAQGLGTYIFLGLQTRNHVATTFGCVCAALLAVILDGLIRLLERGLETRRRSLVSTALVAIGVLLVIGVWPSLASFGAARSPDGRVADRAARDDSDTVSAEKTLAGTRIVTGSKPFAESYLLAELLEAHLESRGAEVDNRPNMGSTILFDALAQSTVDVYVDYSGTIWATLMKREDAASRLDVQIEVAKYLRETHGVLCVGSLGFENAYSLVMRRDRAAELGVRTIAELAPHAAELKVGGDPEVFGRPEWTRVRDAYGLERIGTVGMQAVFLYDAVRDRQVDVATAYSTDGRIDAYDFVVLEDPRGIFPPYDAIVLVSPRAAGNVALVNALLELVNRIDARTMREANRWVEVDGLSPDVAGRRLWERVSARP